ncbi:MAG: response regulator transcription factor [Chitinophagales bacterium]|nr:response regulator transcription factor [Chitinophagales bacterium]
MNNHPIRIILVDDHKLARESWSMLLDYDIRFSVIKECENGPDAIQEVSRLKPDILLVDINMYPLNGFEVTQKVLEADPSMKIIGISVNNQPSYANKMLELGARGFVTKGSPFEEITHAIVEVHNGRNYVCNEIRNMQH